MGFKTCPRCKGALLADRDHHGWYQQCLQCGYHRDLEPVEPATEPAMDITGMADGYPAAPETRS